MLCNLPREVAMHTLFIAEQLRGATIPYPTCHGNMCIALGIPTQPNPYVINGLSGFPSLFFQKAS